MANNNGARDPEEQQNELMATLKAARELGPDMDKAVAASYLEKQKAATQPPQPQQATVAAPGQQRRPMYFAGAPIGLIAYIALLIISGGHLWWMFWIVFCFGGWGWWGWRHDEHMQRRMDRYEWRRARYGYRYGPLQPPAEPTQPQVQQPPQHQYD